MTTILEWLASFPSFDQDAAFSADAEVGFYADQGPVKIRRFRDRVFIGDACDADGKFTGDGDRGTWMPNDTVASGWAVRDSLLLAMSPNGKMAITGASRSSDNTDGYQVPIGVSGFLVNDKPGGSGWALYSDVQHDIPGGWSAGLEVAAKNKGNNFTLAPYGFPSSGVFGLWLAGGGAAATGGLPTNPSNTAIVVLRNAHTWNKGIVFEADALTGCDGLSGAAVAVHMARGHIVRWDAPNGKGADIRSDVSDTAKRVGQVYANDMIYYMGANDQKIVAYQHVANAVNALVISNAATGAAPAVSATGPDTDIDVKLSPKGAGLVVLGPYEAATNSILVKDSAGTVRRLQCV
jgi:hypothetical protein